MSLKKYTLASILGAVPHEVALDATNVLSQFIIQSENFDRALSVCHEL